MTDELEHYGTPRHSGRYPWGSGENPYQSASSFLGRISELRSAGMNDKQIVEALGLRTTSELRRFRTVAIEEKRAGDIARAVALKEHQHSNIAIGKKMGIGESQVRNLLKASENYEESRLRVITNLLEDQIAEKGAIDVGLGVEHSLGITNNRLKTAVTALQARGYELHQVPVQQQFGKDRTTVKVLAPPTDDRGKQWRELYDNPELINVITAFSPDKGESMVVLRKPTIVDPNRVYVRYANDGGAEKDGIIELRRGVPDLDLGDSRYAQVRVSVGKDHFLKGVAVYGDDMPPGKDIIYNVPKNKTGSDLDVMKANKLDDPTNPFGSSIRAQHGALNVVYREGEWEKWSKSLSSQMLSKQSPALAKEQLDLLYQNRRADLDAILSLENPSVRRKLLDTFSEGADSDAEHLKAAALPRQQNAVIIPVNTLKETEVYAPKFKNGETVVLIRHPHGGIFEIPQLKVNNNNKEAKRVLGNARDAIGIHHQVAEQLSGADFDGDSVLVIPNPPNNRHKIKVSPPLEGLKDFDPRKAFPPYEGMPVMSDRTKQMEMGKVSNLITDMTIKGANDSEIARAVRHSMVVIDAEKHKLNYKESERRNLITDLKSKYQNSPSGGASTIVSRSRSEERVPQRIARRASEGGPIDPRTGEKRWTETGETYVDSNGRVVERTMRSTKMAETKDARSLVSKQAKPIEMVYADHANRMKSLANEARRASYNTKTIPYDPVARKTYAKEEASLTAKLQTALKAAPLERQAQILAGQKVRLIKADNPEMTPDQLKKTRARALQEARIATGSKKEQINITDKEWEAIQSGAISKSRLDDILTHADLDRVRELATPKAVSGVAPALIARARSMMNRGYTQADIAEALGISVTTLSKEL